MDKPVKIFTLLIVILCLSIFFTGCTKTSDAANKSANLTAQPTTSSGGALYSAGDIVKSPTGSAGTGWLVLSYDPATDAYSRAFVYQNSDGTWGYRVNANTETSPRKTMEKVYTVKITRVPVSSVPVKTPTVVTVTTRPVTTSATATATTMAGKPEFKSMDPDSGNAGTEVSITDLSGYNFQTGATVMLAHAGSPNINATNVQVTSSSHITCKFTIPSNATTGSWNVVIRNPDGQSVTYNNYFVIHGSTGGTTTTTTTSPTGSIVITSIDPTMIAIGPGEGYQKITIFTSTNLQSGVTAKLVNGQGTVINGRDVYLYSPTKAEVPFNIPAGSQGEWSVVLTNPDGTTGTLSYGFTIR